MKVDALPGQGVGQRRPEAGLAHRQARHWPIRPDSGGVARHGARVGGWSCPVCCAPGRGLTGAVPRGKTLACAGANTVSASHRVPAVSGSGAREGNVSSSGGPHGHHAPYEPRPTPWPLRQAWPVSTGGTAFVLTGGGSLGAVQVGMMAALHEQGIDPDLLVGTSVGAVNAAYVAGPGTTGAPAGRARRPVVGDAPSRRVRRRPGSWLRAAVGGSASLFSAGPVAAAAEEPPGLHAFEDARLQLAVTATDVVTGAGLLLDSGPVVAAVTASAAVPGLLPPVRRGSAHARRRRRRARWRSGPRRRPRSGRHLPASRGLPLRWPTTDQRPGRRR